MDRIHAQLEKMNIPHICHYSGIGSFDLGAASVECTECRIDRGEISLADIVTGRVDPMNRELAWETHTKKYKEEQGLREKGLLPKHIVFPVKKTDGSIRLRYDCLYGAGASADVDDTRICFSCKESVDS